MNEHQKEGRRGDEADGGEREVRVYRFRIDKGWHESPLPDLTGRDLLVIAGKTHPERYKIFQRLGTELKRVHLDEVVHVSDSGEERFVTLPLDQTEGEQTLPLRRDFSLPGADRDALDVLGSRWEAVADGSVPRIVIRDHPVGPDYVPSRTDVMLRLPANYPTTQIDMWYFHPPLARTNGAPIKSLVSDTFEGKTWQGWSRHRTPANPWRPDVDDVGTHLQLMAHCLAIEAGTA